MVSGRAPAHRGRVSRSGLGALRACRMEDVGQGKGQESLPPRPPPGPRANAKCEEPPPAPRGPDKRSKRKPLTPRTSAFSCWLAQAADRTGHTHTHTHTHTQTWKGLDTHPPGKASGSGVGDGPLWTFHLGASLWATLPAGSNPGCPPPGGLLVDGAYRYI